MSYPYAADHPNAGRPDASDSTPELPEIQQEVPAVDVKGQVEVVNAVRTYELPSRIGTSRSYLVSDTDTQPLLGADLRRKRVTLLASATTTGTATGFYVGEREDVRSGMAALWPINVPLVLQHTEQIFVRCATPSAVAQVSIISENWAD